MQRYFLLLISILATCFLKGEIRLKINEYTTSDGLSHRVIGHILQDQQDVMWFATWNGLCSFDGYRFTTFNEFDGANIGRIDRLGETAGGGLWCQSYDNRNFVFDKATKSFSLTDTVPALARPDHFTAPNAETTDKGLLITSTRYHQQFEFNVSNDKNLESTLHARYVDKQGNLWLNYNHRLYKFSFIPLRYEAHHQIDGEQSPFYNEEIRSLLIDRQQRLWLGCKNEKIYVYTANDELIGYLSPDGNISKTPVSFGGKAYHMHETKDGVIWIATKGSGLYRMQPTRNPLIYSATHYHRNNELNSISNNELYFILEDKKKNIWTANYGSGIDQIRHQEDEKALLSFKNFWHILPEKNKGMRVRHLCFIADEILAAATTEGVVLCNLRTSQLQKLDNSNAMQILKTRKGHIFIATLGQGLKELTRHGAEWTLKPVRTNAGELPDIVVSITEDRDNNLWLISDNHLTRMPIDGEHNEKYDESFFGKTLIFSEALPIVNQKGEMLIGTTSGWIRFNPREIRKDSTYVPPILLTEFKAQQHESPEQILMTREPVVKMKKGRADFSISFSALDYVNPGNIHYAYSLEKTGDKPNWINIHNHHEVSFSNLRAGSYELKIKSTNSDGVWVDNVRTVRIEVSRMTPLAILTVILSILFLSGAGIVYHRRRLQHEAARAMPQEEIELNPSCPEIRLQDDIFIEKIMAYMEENMDNPELSVDTFASYMGYSRSRFYKQMKLFINKTPVDFIREIRIKRACYLLESQQYNISEVAFMIGFSDSKYFSKVFKKETGITPSEYQSKNSRKEEVVPAE